MAYSLILGLEFELGSHTEDIQSESTSEQKHFQSIAQWRGVPPPKEVTESKLLKGQRSFCSTLAKPINFYDKSLYGYAVLAECDICIVFLLCSA